MFSHAISVCVCVCVCVSVCLSVCLCVYVCSKCGVSTDAHIFVGKEEGYAGFPCGRGVSAQGECVVCVCLAFLIKGWDGVLFGAGVGDGCWVSERLDWLKLMSEQSFVAQTGLGWWLGGSARGWLVK